MPLWTVRCDCMKTDGDWGKIGEIRFIGNLDYNNLVMATIHARQIIPPNWQVSSAMMQGHTHTETCGCAAIYAEYT